MIIQPILFPFKNLKNEPELFFRGTEPENISENSVSIPFGTEASLETYFNAFSVGKWLEYTKLDNLSLNLKIHGKVEIKAYHAIGTVDIGFFDRERGKHQEEEYVKLINAKAYSATRSEIGFEISQENDNYTIKFKELFREGIVYITIKAIEYSTLLGGFYVSDIDESSLNPVNIAVGICTFKREKAVIGNVNHLLSKIINNPVSPLKERLEIYIADNGQTLDVNHFNSDKVHIFPNPNFGGAGGFTRTMIESLFHDKTKKFTHLIFMDDDILLYPAVLERTFYLLLMLKEEYRNAIVGANMILLDRPYLQQNCGALSLNSYFSPSLANHHFFDLRNMDAVSANEVVNPINYTGWYFTCIPATIISEQNLPMPLFIHDDDIEYGLRNNKYGLIFFNGIGVWHPSVDNKGVFWITYYDIRNRLIVLFVNSLSKKDFKHYISVLVKKILLKIIRYEYQVAEIMVKAIEDFLKGPGFLASLDASRFHSELSKGIKYQPLTLAEVGIDEKDIGRSRISNYKKAFMIQMICNILPSKKSIKAVDINYYNIPYRADRIYIYNPQKNNGLLFKRNQKLFFILLFKTIELKRQLIKKYGSLLKEWKEGQKILTSLPFWEKYLGLNKD